jgi:hypothetical protein
MRGFAAPPEVVVSARQVIVHERIGMNGLRRRGDAAIASETPPLAR